MRVSEAEDEIIAALGDLGKATLGTIAREISKDRSNTLKQLGTLWVKGKVRKGEIENKVFYYLPAREPKK